MKKFVLLTAFLIALCSKGQVGINTTNPQGAFHIDGNKDNPATGIPTALQQANDFVVTPTGSVGLGTVSPNSSAILDISSGSKGLLLPRLSLQNLTDGATVPSPANGLVVYNTNSAITGGLGLYYNNGTPSAPNWFKMASVNDIPTFNTYVLSAMQEFSTANTSDGSYTYDQIVGNCPTGNTRYYVPSTTVFNPVYTITFDKKSVNADKYFLLSLDYRFEFTSINNIVPLKSHWVEYDLELILNGAVIRTFNSDFNISVGGNIQVGLSKLFTANLTGTTLLNTNNILQVRIKPTQSLIKENSGTANGNYATGNSHLLDIKVKDVSFQLFEK
ncbi:hypothetical protein DBR28_13270 [Chryseobacterium sp. HMWF028]|nr:hypothetical protein DBR28_13270 [Chryseobacterium sp. HMWF028]